MRKNRLKELNKLSKKSKSIVFTLLGIFILILLFLNYQSYKNDNQKQDNINYNYINNIISNNSQPTENLLIKRIAQSSNIKAYRTFTIGFANFEKVQEFRKSKDYLLESISGEKKARINYFNYGDQYYIRSVFSEKNDIIYSNQIIHKDDLWKWLKFDEMQEEFSLTSDSNILDDLIEFKIKNKEWV